MIDLIQVQRDLYGLLMSAPQLQRVNIVEERKFILEKMVEVEAIWQTVRPLNGTGYFGNGLLIEAPQIICDSNNVSGPPQTVILSFVSFQNGDAAFTPPAPDMTGVNEAPLQGGGLFAEQIEQYLVDLLQLQVIGGIGTMRVTGQFSEPARDYPGVTARRTKINMTPRQTAQTPRTSIVAVSINNGNADLSTATAGAQIYYTLDGSFPSNPNIAILPFNVTPANVNGNPVNPNSTLYTAPFAVASGQTIRATAYLKGYNPGQIVSIPVP